MTDTMDWLELKGHITEDGKLEIELPQNVESGDVDVWLKLRKPVQQQVEADMVEDDIPFTDEELKAFKTFKYRNPKEVIAEGLLGGLEHLEIEDSVEWVAEQRRKRRERRGNQW